MKISEIKNKELRELAEKRIRKDWEEYINEGSLIGSFDWGTTPEGEVFWSDVYNGNITELPCKAKEHKPLSVADVNKEIDLYMSDFSNQYIQKNIDYNNSLYKKNIFGQDPIEGLKARMSDKFNRIISKGFDDTTEDSMVDLFGYYIHYLIMKNNA